MAHFPDGDGHLGALARCMADAHHHGAITASDATLTARQFRDLVKGRAFRPALIGQYIATPADIAEIIEQAVALFLSHYATPHQAEATIHSRWGHA